MKSKTYIIGFSSLIFFACTLNIAHASERNDATNCACECVIGKGPGHGIQEGELSQIYNAPARFNPTCEWDVFTSASFIYWHVSQECLEFVVARVPNLNNAREIFFIGPDFSYKPGFKISVGTNFGHDNWVGLAEYTWLHMSTDTKSAESNNEMIINNMNWTEPNIDSILLNNATAKWENDLDLLDFELGRSFYSGTSLVLRTFMGPRVVWIDQNYNLTVESTGLNAEQKWNYDSWSVGPRAGLNFKWEVGCGFRFTGNSAASILYRHQEVTSTFTGTLLGVPIANVDFIYKFLRPNVDLNAGIGWGAYFNCDSWHLDVSAAYSFLYFWNENVMAQTVDMIEDFSCHKAGDLMFHGLTATLRVDF